MRTVAVGWEVYQRTGQALSLGLVGLVLALPVLVLALPAGAAADRYSRRTIIILAQLGLAASALGLAWASAVSAPIPLVYLFLLGTGICRAVGWPAASALVVRLVPTADFANAAMCKSVAFQLSATLGPLLGGFLLAQQGPTLVYILDAASSLVLVICLFGIKLAPHVRTTKSMSWSGMWDGIRFLGQQPIIVSTMTLDMVAVLFSGATALLPIYAEDILHVGAVGFGWMRAMPSLGAITMAVVLSIRPPFERAGRALLVAVVIFGAATVVFGMSRSYLVSLAALFILGAADNISVVVRATLLQLLTPDSMRGRVSAVNAIFIGTSNEIGEFESGVVAQWLGPVIAVAGGGFLTIATVSIVAFVWPQLRQFGSLRISPPDEPPMGPYSGKPSVVAGETVK